MPDTSAPQPITNPIAEIEQPATAAETAEPAKPVYPTPELIHQVCPDSDLRNIQQYHLLVLKAMAEAGLVSRNQLIAIVATIYVETGQWAPIKEYGGDSAHYAPFYGRGWIQLTWEDNYKAADQHFRTGGQLVAEPDLALEPELSAKIMMWYWQGGTGNPSIVPYAERGDWANVRSIVNGGSAGMPLSDLHGVDVFMGAVERGLQVFTQGIDPDAVGAAPLQGNYGTGCIDAGAAGSRTLVGTHNPATQADALSYALGLHALDRLRSHEAHLTLNVGANPDILKLDAQKQFQLAGFGSELDGDYVTDEVIFYPLEPEGIIAEVDGYKGDPSARPPQVFLHDSTAGLTPKPPQVGRAPAASEIPEKIYQAAVAARGKSTAHGPGGGNVACAFAVNEFCVKPAGLAAIGSNPDSVPSMVEALNSGRGQRIDRGQAIPGDIWVSPGSAHVGIVMTKGATKVLSNSSSRAAFAWEDDIDAVNSYYGGSEVGIWRVVA